MLRETKKKFLRNKRRYLLKCYEISKTYQSWEGSLSDFGGLLKKKKL